MVGHLHAPASLQLPHCQCGCLILVPALWPVCFQMCPLRLKVQIYSAIVAMGDVTAQQWCPAQQCFGEITVQQAKHPANASSSFEGVHCLYRLADSSVHSVPHEQQLTAHRHDLFCTYNHCTEQCKSTVGNALPNVHELQCCCRMSSNIPTFNITFGVVTCDVMGLPFLLQ